MIADRPTRFMARRCLAPATAGLRPVLAAVFLAIVANVFGTGARSGQTASSIEPPRLAQAPEPLCFCWSDGHKIAEGTAACIRTSQGRRVAWCGRVINMMSWQLTETPCPDS